MRVVFAGGGTGGHFCPGLALAEELRRRQPESRLLFLCTERDRGYAELVGAGIEVVPLPGRQSGSWLRRMLSLVPAVVQAVRLLRRFRPDVVVGLGGYGSLAPVVCAALLRVPCLLLEQNVVPGRSTRWLSHVATEVASQWGEAVPFFACRGKVSVTGNPIRSQICRRDRAAVARELGLEPDRPTLLIAGGSQGARPLNDLLMAALAHFGDALRRLQFVHLAGRADRDAVRAAYDQHGARAAVFGFLTDMSLAYSACDLALSRAGGTTLAELTALGIPAILVPYPYAADDHQKLNARVLDYHRAALCREQHRLSPQGLAREVVGLLASPARLGLMARRSRALGVPRAASVVADRVAALARARRRVRAEPVAALVAGEGRA